MEAAVSHLHTFRILRNRVWKLLISLIPWTSFPVSVKKLLFLSAFLLCPPSIHNSFNLPITSPGRHLLSHYYTKKIKVQEVSNLYNIPQLISRGFDFLLMTNSKFFLLPPNEQRNLKFHASNKIS